MSLLEEGVIFTRMFTGGGWGEEALLEISGLVVQSHAAVYCHMRYQLTARHLSLVHE